MSSFCLYALFFCTKRRICTPLNWFRGTVIIQDDWPSNDDDDDDGHLIKNSLLGCGLCSLALDYHYPAAHLALSSAEVEKLIVFENASQN